MTTLHGVYFIEFIETLQVINYYSPTEDWNVYINIR